MDETAKCLYAGVTRDAKENSAAGAEPTHDFVGDSGCHESVWS